VTPGILPSALRASLRRFKIAPGDFVEPLDFIARLAALVPKPLVNLTRFHGVFAPNSRDRAAVTPAKRGKGAQPKAFEDGQEKTPVERHAAMSWAQRLKRVFGIETCPACGGALRIIACIEDPAVINKIPSLVVRFMNNCRVRQRRVLPGPHRRTPELLGFVRPSHYGLQGV
jgi:hypothetical protein